MSLGGSGLDATAGSSVIALRYASAEELAKVLQPFVANGGKILADPLRNAILIDGEPATRETLISLVRAFDTNILAGQSYALFPVGSGGVKDFAGALQEALRSQSGGALASVVRVVPMERVNAVLVVSSQQRYVDEARRVYALVDRQRGQTMRSWHVMYLQNSHTNDVAYVLQRAFTPNDVTARPEPGAGQSAPGQSTRQSLGGQGGSGLGGQGSGSQGSGNQGLGSSGLGSSGLGSQGGGQGGVGFGGNSGGGGLSGLTGGGGGP